MIIVDQVRIEEAVATGMFSCDLAKCRGACCTLEGGRGAPLLDEEKDLVERAVPVVLPHLPERSRAEIERRGPVDGWKGAYATTCIDDRDCVFVVYDGEVAKCSIEAAFRRGEYPWPKPVSCHLFPIRHSAGGADLLRYETIPQCAPGRDRGAAEGTPLHEFLRAALVRRFGEDWYARFDEAIRGAAGRAASGKGP